MLFRGKRYAEIDRQPFAMALAAHPVDRQVHADLADAAKRREYQFLLRMRHGLERDPFRLNHRASLTFLLAHDLFRKPVPTFRDHALRDPNSNTSPAVTVASPPG